MLFNTHIIRLIDPTLEYVFQVLPCHRHSEFYVLVLAWPNSVRLKIFAEHVLNNMVDKAKPSLTPRLTGISSVVVIDKNCGIWNQKLALKHFPKVNRIFEYRVMNFPASL